MTSPNTTVLFVLPHLGGGGAERTFVNLVNHLDRGRFKPVMALFKLRGPYLPLLKGDVELHDLRSSRARYSFLPLARTIRSVAPNVMLSTLTHVNVTAMVAQRLSGRQVPVVVRQSTHQTAQAAAGVGGERWREWLIRWSYRRAARVIALSNGVRQDLIARYNLPEEQVVTIYNPIDIDHILRLAAEPVDHPQPLREERHGPCLRIIAAGRLSREKGVDLLLKALARLRHIPYHLWVLGDGEERRNLQELVGTLEMSDRVSFLGFVQNPYAWMAQADLFALPSRWEGFGHVIAEAMVCGVPVLATRCPAGPEEIITDGVDGRLCEPESVEALARHIEELWGQPEKRAAFASAARQSVQRFHVKRIVEQYEQLLSAVASTPSAA